MLSVSLVTSPMAQMNCVQKGLPTHNCLPIDVYHSRLGRVKPHEWRASSVACLALHAVHFFSMRRAVESHTRCQQCGEYAWVTDARWVFCDCGWSRPCKAVGPMVAILGDGPYYPCRQWIDKMLARVEIGRVISSPRDVVGKRYAYERDLDFSVIVGTDKAVLSATHVLVINDEEAARQARAQNLPTRFFAPGTLPALKTPPDHCLRPPS